jgi:uncharacterized DUF497 family protein
MKFCWDENKNRINKSKHGISFETAKLVFDDPLHISIQDRHENSEERWQTLGLVHGLAIILVAHSVVEENNIEVIRLYLLVRRPSMRHSAMKKLTKQQADELKHLAFLPDDTIDTSDIPEQTNWEKAVVGRFYSKKPNTSVEIDNEILSWFKAKSSRDYQRMINKALVEYMKQHNQ